MRKPQQQTGYIFRDHGSWYVRFRDNILQPDGSVKRKQVAKLLAPICDQFRNERQSG